MSIPQAGGGPIGSRDDLVAYLADGSKPREAWRIGTEHEKFGYDLKTLKPLPYEGRPGIKAMLEGLKRFGWEPVMEGPYIIGLKQGGAAISLEPGGQFELSGAPLRSLHETCAEVNTHLDQVKEVAGEMGAGFLGMGFAPMQTLAETPVMPKGRYGIMRNYMPKVGSMGLEMMFRTCTIQVNLDFASEADMVKKMRVGLALQPVATAMFAASPFREGKPNGFLSYRSHIWTDTDNARSGMLPFAFEDGMGFERYVDYALDVPMYFVYRDGVYHDVAGRSFRDFMARKIEAVKQFEPTMADWADHLTTIFPEVRLKKFLEMRGADGGLWRRLCALPALWVGIYYDQVALDAAWDLVKDWTDEDRWALRHAVPKLALRTPIRGRSVRDYAHEMLEISQSGLRRRAQTDSVGGTEEGFLQPLQQIVRDGRTRAEELLSKYHGEWNRDLSRLYAEFSY
ncbi:MAG TPA: glutamate--cysteine ligase [Alphaproteobacteria bacterium]|nr:glutamate--cysteine ligase [Alphaproteobacteria bacterium]